MEKDKKYYLDKLNEYLKINDKKELIEKYFFEIWNFTNEFDENEFDYFKIRIDEFIQSLSSKIGLITFKNGEKINFTEKYPIYKGLNNVLESFSEEQVELEKFIVEFEPFRLDGIFYIKDYYLFEKICEFSKDEMYNKTLPYYQRK